ncbi:alpha/beta hydrolase [Pseudomonas pergaminensis]|uniref:Alpha/beta hydrolase n=1 Tax=Pseudomonas pergaminensis TaxID=2853159 RepID=A0ABD7TRA6_9PSED|nr:alpha/beta hydrolase [Pseudomonas pergaminensis]USW04067.1 alpha/beta hydrolase [Pseudomonas pergaminensis]
MSRHVRYQRTLAGFYKACVLMITALLIACQSPREALQQLAQEHGRQVDVLPGDAFPLLILTPQTAEKITRLRVYLEGDGHAWSTATQPSLDPSPHTLLVPRLAVDDPTPNAYLARPCQFVMAAACQSALWTNRRFSQEVVTRLSQALDQLKQRYGNREFELVGYSGGAALALLLAAQRNDVTQVQTLAGNLSPRLWATMKGLSPLDGSLDPLDYRKRLALLPQRHLIGEADLIIPSGLADRYQQALDSHLSEYVPIQGVTHDRGWEAPWSQWVKTPLVRENAEVKAR